MTQSRIETVFAKIRAEYPHYPTTKPVTKSTILATLDWLGEDDIPSATLTWGEGDVPLTVREWLLSKRAEIESAE
jgi:hypothetical protein